jgi:GTP-binding protein EngB required for normal cell division
MNGERDTEVVDEVEDVEENASPEDTVVITEDLEDIGDPADTAELDVDELVAKIDKIDDAEQKKEVHRRLEELAERKREEAELDSTYNFNLDDEL